MVSRAAVLTDDSRTTAPDASGRTVRGYLQGSFASIAGVADELEKRGFEVDLIIHTVHGPVKGRAPAKVLADGHAAASDEGASSSTQEAFLNVVAQADAMLISLTQASFDSLVVPIWDDILERLRPDAVVCLAGARSSLEKLNRAKLREQARETHIYERRGVARLDRPTRDRFLRATAELHPDNQQG